jgi:hypothetical protein
MYTGRTPPWLRQEVERFVVSYRRLQQIELAIPDCFSIRSEHIKVDHEAERLTLIDTNNVVLVRRELEHNALFRSNCPVPLEDVGLDALHDVFERICARYDFDNQHLHSPRPDFSFRDARAIEQLVRYFPRHFADNQYLEELVSTFELPGARDTSTRQP